MISGLVISVSFGAQLMLTADVDGFEGDTHTHTHRTVYIISQKLGSDYEMNNVLYNIKLHQSIH